MEIGYALSSEEHRPLDLVRHAQRAEEAGFPYALISDHFHPWTDRQGEAPFVWGVIGAIAVSTETLRLGTGVTCPLIRTHPAIVAQAAATAAASMPGRFCLGVGTGENLNEHVVAEGWPPADERLEMLEEAVALMRRLWEGALTSWEGKHYRVDNARLYTLPDETVEVVVAAGGPEAAELAGRIGDGLVSTAPDAELVQEFERAGGHGQPRYGQLTVCYAETEEEARQTALEWWPIAGLKGPMSQELPLPSDFEEAAEMVDEESIAEHIVCGPDPRAHLEGIGRFAEAGFDHVYVHQVGPDQDGFFDFYAADVLSEAEEITTRARAGRA
jgi:G6PDH family F420-dependent oxidoreductase